METNTAQQVLFRHVKNLLPPHLSLVDEIADTLEISNDSAYRRIRGETHISLDEIKRLCDRFNISLDELLHLQSDAYVFRASLAGSRDYDYKRWLQTVLSVMEQTRSAKPCYISYVAKEFPFYYYFLVPEIASFKSFFFMKSILYYETWKSAKFSIGDDYSEYHALWREIFDAYATIPGTEIWTVENITSTIRQIEFYHSTGSFRSQDDIALLFDKIGEMLDHVQTQAEHGIKLRRNQRPADTGTVPYHLYVNELIMGDNMQVMQTGERYTTFLNHTTLNYLTTTNERFNQYTRRNVENIVQKSIPISTVNEKDRIRFFNHLREKLEAERKKILH